MRPDIRRLAVQLGHPAGIDGYLRQTWVIVPDPDGIEYIQAPELQLRMAYEVGHYFGDCDDAATFAACLLAALDWPCTLVAYRLGGNLEFSHVNVVAPLLEYAPGENFIIDPIVPESQLPIRGVAETLSVSVP